jgi:hypothetical protein
MHKGLIITDPSGVWRTEGRAVRGPVHAPEQIEGQIRLTPTNGLDIDPFTRLRSGNEAIISCSTPRTI